MFNLKKIMKFAKANSFCKAFNLMKKRAATAEEEEFYRLHPEMREDPVGQSVPPVEYNQNIPVQDVGQQMQVPPPAPVATSVSVLDPTQIDERMNEWIRSNKDEIGLENKTGLVDLIEKKNNFPDESPLAPDPILYNALSQDRSLKETLVGKIRSTGVQSSDKARLFVEIMMAKTELLRGDIEAREKAMSEKEKSDEQKERERIEEVRQTNPYYKPDALPDTNLWMEAQNKILKLSPQQKESLFEMIHRRFTDQQLSEAVMKRLGPPSPGKLDQRMNFFLQNLNHLQGVLQSDAILSKTLKQELDKLGIKDPDLMKALKVAQRAKGAQTQVCNILTILKGNDLLSILGQLVNTLDSGSPDPAIAAWIKKGFFEREEDLSYNAEENESGESPSDNLSGQTSSDAGEYQSNAADLREASSRMSSLAKTYVAPTIDAINKISRRYFLPVMSTSIQRHKELASILADPQNPKYPKNAKDREKLKNFMRNLVDRFTLSEVATSFCASSASQLSKIFDGTGKVSSSDKKNYYYTNQQGTIKIPRSILRDIFSSEEAGTYGDIKTNEEYIEAYKAKTNSPFKPFWKHMVNYRTPYFAQAKIGLIFTSVNNMKKKGSTLDSIRETIMSQSDTRVEIDRICGLDDNTPQDIRRQVVDDFLYMTLNQNEEDVDMKRIIDTFNSATEYAKKRKEADKIKDPDEKVEVLKELESEASEMYHALKTKIGASFFPLLYQMDQASKEKGPNGKPAFDHDHIRALIDLFDHHPTPLKNFFGVGSTDNSFDKIRYERQLARGDQNPPPIRTNTELYYEARGEKVPEGVRSLIAIKNDGKLERSKGINANAKKLQWHQNFWELYKSFGVVERSVEDLKEKAQKVEDRIKTQYAYANAKAYKVKSNQKLFGKILQSLRADVRDQLYNVLAQWDGVSPLPINYYGYLGQKTTKNVIGKFEDKKKDIQKQIDMISKKSDKIRKQIEGELSKSGYKVDLNVLRLLSAYYEKTMTKIAYWESILQGMSKFASKDISTEDIQIRIDLCRQDFYNLFQRVMS